jgi:hypothetical protein
VGYASGSDSVSIRMANRRSCLVRSVGKFATSINAGAGYGK